MIICKIRRKKKKKEKEEEKKEEKKFLQVDGRTGGPTKGSTRGPRGTKNISKDLEKKNAAVKHYTRVRTAALQLKLHNKLTQRRLYLMSWPEIAMDNFKNIFPASTFDQTGLSSTIAGEICSVRQPLHT